MRCVMTHDIEKGIVARHFGRKVQTLPASLEGSRPSKEIIRRSRCKLLRVYTHITHSSRQTSRITGPIQSMSPHNTRLQVACDVVRTSLRLRCHKSALLNCKCGLLSGELGVFEAITTLRRGCRGSTFALHVPSELSLSFLDVGCGVLRQVCQQVGKRVISLFEWLVLPFETDRTRATSFASSSTCQGCSCVKSRICSTYDDVSSTCWRSRRQPEHSGLATGEEREARG